MFAIPFTSPRSLRRALVCVLVCALTMPAHARGGGDFRSHRAAFRGQGEARVRQVERAQRQQQAGRFQQQREAAPERTAPRPAAVPGQTEGQGRPPVFQPAAPSPSPADPATRPGRLTPDERRALRQQIDEAGRDLYRPGRP